MNTVRQMSAEDLREILKRMMGKTTDAMYKGVLPSGVKKIMRVAARMSDCTEVVLERWEEGLLRQIARDVGLRYERNRRADEFACGCAMRVMERMRATDAINSYQITKPRRFWFSAHVADVVNESVRVYDTTQSIELAAELLEHYLKTEGRTSHEEADTTRANGYSEG